MPPLAPTIAFPPHLRRGPNPPLSAGFLPFRILLSRLSLACQSLEKHTEDKSSAAGPKILPDEKCAARCEQGLALRESRDSQRGKWFR